MYERFYGLRERPFALSPDPDYLYPSRVHSEALDYLRYGLESHAGFIVITGEIGSGKTTLLQALLRGLDSQTTVGRIVNTMLDPRELIETIMIDFGLDPAGRTKPLLLRDLAQYLVDQRIAGRMVLLVIDEAQNLTVAALEELRMLSNLETEKSKLLQVVLVGQPNLREKLAAPELEQLRQRITVSYHLMPLDAEETANYINHRLRRAALGVPPSFPREVTNEIHARSRGVPRVVNVICDAALVFGYAEERRHIDLRLMHDVLSELESTGVLPAQAEMPAPSEVAQPASAMQPRSLPASIPASGRNTEAAAISPRTAPPTPPAVTVGAAPARTPVTLPAPQAAPAPSPMPAHAVAALPNTSLREAVDTPRPKPVEPARPAAVQPPRHEPLEAPRPERVEAPRPSPVEVPRPAPVEGPPPERVEIPRPEPIEAPRPERVEIPHPARVEVPRTEPVQAPRPERVDAPSPEQVVVPRPERVEAPRPAPVEGPRPERIEGLRPVAAVSTPPPPAAAPRIESSYAESLSAHAGRIETVTPDRYAAPRESFLVDAPFRPTREEQIRIAEAEAAARATLDARLAQREAAIRQRERELAEQRRILAEEYRLLRSQRAAVSAAAGLGMGARSARVDLQGAQPNDRSAFTATRPEGSFWAWLKRLVGGSRPVEGMSSPR